MSFLESLGITPPSQIRLALIYPYAPQDVVSDAHEAERQHAVRVAPHLHSAVTAQANADPAVLAMADQMVSEFRDTPSRGHQPVTGTHS